MGNGGTMSQRSSDTEREEPFRRIKRHRQTLRDINQMHENLDELEDIVREAEWIELGGRGTVRVEYAERLCDGVEGSMPYILEAIQELAEDRVEAEQ